MAGLNGPAHTFVRLADDSLRVRTTLPPTPFRVSGGSFRYRIVPLTAWVTQRKIGSLNPLQIGTVSLKRHSPGIEGSTRSVSSGYLRKPSEYTSRGPAATG
jgi:hypothetical protein